MPRRVVIVPGRMFGPTVPQLFFPAFAAIRRGAEVEWIDWAGDAPVDGAGAASASAWVDERVDLTDADLVIGKSLGSYAAVGAARLGIPGVWVTPLLTSAPIVPALESATAPFLLVGGTADETWDGATARRLTPHVLELPDADHGLFVPGPLERSAANIGLLASAVEAFLDEVVWPAARPAGRGSGRRSAQ